MNVERNFTIRDRTIKIVSSALAGEEGLLHISVSAIDNACSEPVAIAKGTATRNQLFDLACGIFCIVLDSEPEGTFDTSFCLDSNNYLVSFNRNVTELMGRVNADDPVKAVRNSMAVFQRLEQRLPVLQSCQRALELCESELDVNILESIALDMQKNIAVDERLEVTSTPKPALDKPEYAFVVNDAGCLEFRVDGSYAGLNVVPGKAEFEILSSFPTPDRFEISCWLSPKLDSSSQICSALNKLNLLVAVFCDGSFQIRSDLTAPDREDEFCAFSPRSSFSDLLSFVRMARGSFEKLGNIYREEISSGEAPVPPEHLRELVKDQSPT